MKTISAILTPTNRYHLHESSAIYECIEAVDDYYSSHTYRLRHIITGWELVAHGVNMYGDGSIDWDFSTGGFFNTKYSVI